MFRLDENYDTFYALAAKSNDFKWVDKLGAGRMLRAATFWEDMVKMLCTTNCTWRLTQIMTENLVNILGDSKNIAERKVFTFPEPKTVAACTEDYLRKEIKMGYRAPYLLELAQAIDRRETNPTSFENENIETAELYKNLRSIKGFGDYAVSNLLKLLGRYDYLGADSWSRQKFFEKHNRGKPCDDKKIFSYYKKYRNWAGLFFWMDVCEDWYRKDIPW